MKKLTAISSVLASFALTSAAYAVDACRLDPKGVKHTRPVNDVPNYFFRAFPVQNKVSYNGSEVNYILDLDTGDKIAIPGPWDPVPVWDEKTMTIPTRAHGMEFYAIDQLLKGAATPQLASEVLGNYQSIGRLGKSKYRMAIAYGYPFVYDFEVLKADETGIEIKAIAPDGQATFRKVCPEVDVYLKLPMLSKDGRYLAGLDMRESKPVTKIWEIQDDLSCKEKANLRMATGKVDFSFDGKRVTFHMEKNPNANFFVASGLGSALDVYELNLSTMKIRPLTFNRTGNAYYPVYRKDGKIVYIEQYENGKFGFVVADPKEADEISLLDLGVIQGFKKFYPNLALNFEIQSDILKAIGQSWYQHCAGGSSGSNDSKAIIIAKSLTRGQCVEVVESKWELLGAGFAAQGLSKEMILAACQTLAGDPVEPVNPGPVEPEDPFTAAKTILNNKCTICHGPKVPVKDLAKMKTLPSKRPENSMLIEVIRRIKSEDESERMPLGTELSAQEKETVLKYLESAL